MKAIDLNPLVSLPASGLTAAAIARLTGEGAIRLYGNVLEHQPSVALPAESIG